MKSKKNKIIPLILLSSIAYNCDGHNPDYPENIFQKGDIIAHKSKTNQSSIIEKVTQSRYTHMGIIYFIDSLPYVIEAVQPTKKTPLDKWISRGVNNQFSLMRINSDYESKIPDVISEAKKHIGKDYDLLFKPCDEKMYCSELVQKAFERGASISLGEWENLSDFIDNPIYSNKDIKKEINNRWKNSPMDHVVVTPKSIMGSKYLKKIYTNF